jgi:hypothetical protein
MQNALITLLLLSLIVLASRAQPVRLRAGTPSRRR